ncbi:hypothetical protein GCM10023198_36900 [Promicromonospora umidemergens]|uniref:Uncharacterized protein n=1 Tax=Promicromonospora umidemergens TaxID=629679 RepID=A0ABP8XLL3_9MICO
MTGYLAILDGREVWYLTSLDRIEGGEDLPQFDRDDDNDLSAHPRMRRALLWARSGSAAGVYSFLHWSDGTDLDGLDNSIRGGGEIGERLGRALVVECRWARCGSCGLKIRVAVPDTGNPFVTPERLRAHRWVKSCPACGQALRPYVAEIVRVVADSPIP